MVSRRGCVGSAILKRVRHFYYDYVATFFDVFHLEVRGEIMLLELKESWDCIYHFDSKIVGYSLKWVLNSGRFQKW